MKLDLEAFFQVANPTFTFTKSDYYGTFLVYDNNNLDTFKPRLFTLQASSPQLFYSTIAYNVDGARLEYLSITLLLMLINGRGETLGAMKDAVKQVTSFLLRNGKSTKEGPASFVQASSSQITKLEKRLEKESKKRSDPLWQHPAVTGMCI